MVGVVIILLALTFTSAGVYAIFSGCRDEYHSRRPSHEPHEPELLAEIEEWLKQQQ